MLGRPRRGRGGRSGRGSLTLAAKPLAPNPRPDHLRGLDGTVGDPLAASVALVVEMVEVEVPDGNVAACPVGGIVRVPVIRGRQPSPRRAPSSTTCPSCCPRWLLDGRNRLAACKLAGVDPTFVVVDTDAAAFVLSSNDRRRHASTGARAASVALVLNAEGKRKNYRWERGSVPDAGDGDTSETRSRGSRNWAQSVAQAGTVLDHLPELLPEVAAGSGTWQRARWGG